MDAEQFLRKHFGLTGEYYTEAFKEIQAIKDEKERESAMDDFLDDETADCQKQFTREAWAAWGKALEMFSDLEKEGVLRTRQKWRLLSILLGTSSLNSLYPCALECGTWVPSKPIKIFKK